jgi:hypothetical protein
MAIRLPKSFHKRTSNAAPAVPTFDRAEATYPARSREAKEEMARWTPEQWARVRAQGQALAFGSSPQFVAQRRGNHGLPLPVEDDA